MQNICLKVLRSSPFFNFPNYDALNSVLKGVWNVTQSEGTSETSISSRLKTNLSTMDFYADLCLPRLSESFSV